MERRVVLQLVGETMRETGVLAGLFIPIDSAFAERPMGSVALAASIVVSALLIVCGILLEAKNR